MYRSLIHYWRVNLAVLAGAAVATAVLSGALVVGDSIRGSLRDLTLERLGAIDAALVTDRFFRESLAEELVARPDSPDRFAAAVPAILLRGAAVHAETGARASRIAIQGVDERFGPLFEGAAIEFSSETGQIFPPVVVNESLRRELGANVGDSLILNFGLASNVPRDTLMGETDPEDVLGALRVTVSAVVPDAGVGRFSLAPNQQATMNAFVSLPRLQRALGQRRKVNAVFLAAVAPGADLERSLAETVEFDDLGLDVDSRDAYLSVTSQEFVLRPLVDRAVGEIAGGLGVPLLRIQSYLANSMRVENREVPYSMVAALDPVPGPDWSSLMFADGTPVDEIGEDEIVLNAWTATDLHARPGDALELVYFEVGPREELVEKSAMFRIKGILRFDGLARDRSLTPNYPGIQDADDMSAWDPPFPVDLTRIREEDEQYWDDFGPTPKAFVSAATGRRLWSTRFGTTTSARLGLIPGTSAAETAGKFREALLQRMPPETFGLVFRAVKAEGLQASAGATDFAGLFVGFSFFLIISSALLVGLLFSLNIEQRAGQVGLLLAVGYPLRAVRRRLLFEGGVLAALGASIGLLAGVAYAGMLMLGLRTVWRPAVGSSALFLHVQPMTLVLGWVIAVIVILFSIALTIRRLNKVSPPSLLAGSLRLPVVPARRRLTSVLAWGGLIGGLGMMIFAIVTGKISSMGLAFGSGSMWLVAGLAWFAIWCRGSRRRGAVGARGLAGLAARNSSWNPGRSILSVALVGSACFVIVAVAANKHEFGAELDAKSSASGGFALIAESEVPVHQDLNRAGDLSELGFSSDASKLLSVATVVPFRFLPGDDTSCLNLYQPEKPRILGVLPEFVDRGGFTFQQTVEGAGEQPWSLLDLEIEAESEENGVRVPVIPALGDFNSMQWILHLSLGQDLTLEDEYGAPVRLRLVGTFSKSLFQSEMLISERQFLAHFPSRSGYSYFLIDAPPDRSTEVGLSLESVLAPYGFDITTTRDKLASYEVVQNTYLSTFQTLGALGLLLGTIGLGVVLFRNVIERRGELATLRAFGFRRSTLAWMVLIESAFLLFVGMLVGTLSAFVGVAPRLATMHVPWASLFATLAVVVLVGMLSSIVAVSGVLRVPLLATLKSDR